MNFPSEPASALFFYGGESLTVIFNALEKQFWIKYNIIPYRIYCKRLFNKAFDSHNLLYLFAEHNDMCSYESVPSPPVTVSTVLPFAVPEGAAAILREPGA